MICIFGMLRDLLEISTLGKEIKLISIWNLGGSGIANIIKDVNRKRRIYVMIGDKIWFDNCLISSNIALTFHIEYN